MPTRNINLTDRLDKVVERSIASGRYGNASEVVRDALRLLEAREKAEREKLRELKKAIQEGIDSLKRGEVTRIRGPKELAAFLDKCAEEGRQMHSQKSKRRA
jgi:antitoxin ParD1/3/4